MQEGRATDPWRITLLRSHSRGLTQTRTRRMIKEPLLHQYTTSTAHANRRGFDKLPNVILTAGPIGLKYMSRWQINASDELGTEDKYPHTSLQKVCTPECFCGFCFVNSFYFYRLTIILYKIFNSAFDFGAQLRFGHVCSKDCKVEASSFCFVLFFR